MKKYFLVFAVLLSILLTSTGAILVWAWTEDRPADASQTKLFRIPPGEPLALTAQRLSHENLIRNALVFRWLFQFWQGDGTFPSGTFEVPGNLTAREAAVFFRNAQPIQIKITVPEGWTSSKIARLLEEKNIVGAQDFLEVVHNPSALGSIATGLTTLEGRLFPDTYRFSLETPALEVARTFLQTFRLRTESWVNRYSAEEFQLKVILASIVEREYRVTDEAPLVASVFANRLSRGIPLGSCATIEYILTEIQGRPHPKRIFFVHTEIPSPFNTYLNKGLPPAAIANPGLTALKAVFEPRESDYLYFVVADPNRGTHTFSSRYTQHQKAREAYLATFVTKG